MNRPDKWHEQFPDAQCPFDHTLAQRIAFYCLLDEFF